MSRECNSLLRRFVAKMAIFVTLDPWFDSKLYRLFRPQLPQTREASTTSRRRRELELAGITEEIRSLLNHRLHD